MYYLNSGGLLSVPNWSLAGSTSKSERKVEKQRNECAKAELDFKTWLHDNTESRKRLKLFRQNTVASHNQTWHSQPVKALRGLTLVSDSQT